MTSAPVADQVDPHAGWTEIAIESPLPLGVAGALMQMIGRAWPTAVIKTSPSRYDRALTMLIDARPDPARIEDDAIAAIAAEAAQGPDGTRFVNFRESDDAQWISVAPPEELCTFLGAVAHQIFTTTDATNYIEWSVTSESTTYLLTVAKSPQQHPHALLKEAQGRIKVLEAAAAIAADTPAEPSNPAPKKKDWS